MTRQDVLDSYEVNDHGVIETPGKFEGEMLYVPYFYDSYLNGCADEDDGEVLTFNVAAEDLKEFPELEGVKTVQIYEREDGFVCEA